MAMLLANHPLSDTPIYICIYICILYISYIVEGSLEVKLPTIWTDDSRDGKSQRREEEKKERENQKKEDPGARKGSKVAKHCVFPVI